ncbi:MAG: endopeptidase La, partial [Oscillospiraceae bacterium]|nr:endopeptidase La [Oscillospiraceae bacterium]
VRSDVAMTGEVPLRGRVLAIGGLKEKTMAAKRNGIRTVLIPKENLRDLAEIDPVVRESLRFVEAEIVDTVLAEALYPVEVSGEQPAPAAQEPEPVITAFVPVEKQETPLRQ